MGKRVQGRKEVPTGDQLPREIQPQKEKPTCRMRLKSRPRCMESPRTLGGRPGRGPHCGLEWLPTTESLVKAEPGCSTKGLRPEKNQGWQG